MCGDVGFCSRYLLRYIYRSAGMFKMGLKEILICPELSVKSCSLVPTLLQICIQISVNFFQGKLFNTSISRSFLRDNLSELSWTRSSTLSAKEKQLSVSQKSIKGKTVTWLQQNYVSYLSTGSSLEFYFCVGQRRQRNSKWWYWRKCFHASGLSVPKE